MKYSQYSHKKTGSAVFYIIIAICLIIIGVAAWFAFSRMNDTTPKNNISSIDSKLESKMDEYQSDLDSYNDNVPNTPSEIIESNTASKETEKEEYTSTAEKVKVKAYSMPVNGEILKDFSSTALQYSSTYNDMRLHTGVDIACTDGTLVGACTEGTVQEIEDSGNYGKTVVIDHGDGLIIKYCGLKNITVEKGSRVNMSDSIGAVTTIPCESSDQSHLHIEAFENGKSISFLKFFE